jgi:CNT family concentrative nucleoside transporter
MRERAISAFGMLVMMLLAFALCPAARRRLVKLRTVLGGLSILIAFALIVLRTPANRLFLLANDAVDRLLAFSRDGASFVFGRLASDSQSFGFIFAFQVLPTILFFSALMSLLYHLRVMPLLIEGLGRLLSRGLGTSGAESFSTVADIFVGQTEAPLVIKPYLAKMSVSELNACMVAGFATTAGGVLAAYVAMLAHAVPGIAGHLIACSVMSAPASLVIAKLMLPESADFDVTREARVNIPQSSENVLDAITQGTGDGVRLAVNVGAMLIVFLALTALLNAALSSMGSALFGRALSLESIFGWVFSPLAWLMGVPSADVTRVAQLLGQKTVLNEFVAYSHMAEMLARDHTG